MGERAKDAYVSYAEYLDIEEKSSTRHEWLDGAVYDTPGGTPTHAGLAAAVITALSQQLAGKRCRVFSGDLRILVLATRLSTYPDVGVVCGKLESDPESPTAVTNPTVLVEVHSDSTEAYDRGEKFAHYRRIPSLREYVLLAQTKPSIEVFRKNDAGMWVLAVDAGAGETASLESIDCVLTLNEIYADPLAEPSGRP